MSKPDRQTQLHLGEQRLAEWGLPAHAGVAALHQVSGRDPAADLAIAARLGAHADPAGVEALTALEAATSDKLVHKEIKRSLYRLERRGVAVPHPAPSKPALTVPPAALEGWLSAVDGNGDQLAWLTKPRVGGLAHLFAVINDPRGLREIELSETTRKALRAARQEMLDRHEIRMIDVDWRYCDYLIDRAWRWATEKGLPVSGDYPRLRAQLIKQPVTEMQPLIFTRLDADAVRAQPQLVADSAQLLEEKEFRTWFFDREVLGPYIDEMLEAKSSPLVLAPVQQEERFRVVVERAIAELFGGEMQSSWARRLEEMAHFLHETARPEQGKRALAAALALAASNRGGRDIGICEQLVRTSLAAFLQAEEERQAEEARTSLVLTPQQAAREAQQRQR
jgi:hypothetical protein